MRNCDVAVPGACVTRRSGLWIVQGILFAASFLIVNQGFAQGSNFRVVYAEVEGVSALEAGDLARGMRILRSQLKKADGTNRSDVWATLCGAYIISLSLYQAEEACDAAVETGPSFAALNNRGVLRAYRRDFDGAREDFDRARPLQLEAYLKELMAKDVRLVAADNYRLISKVLARRSEETGRSTAPIRTAEIEEPVQKLRH
jgi:hypothetical protein